MNQPRKTSYYDKQPQQGLGDAEKVSFYGRGSEFFVIVEEGTGFVTTEEDRSCLVLQEEAPDAS